MDWNSLILCGPQSHKVATECLSLYFRDSWILWQLKYDLVNE